MRKTFWPKNGLTLCEQRFGLKERKKEKYLQSLFHFLCRENWKETFFSKRFNWAYLMMGSLAGCCLLQDLSLGLIITSSWDVSGTLGLSFNCLCFYFFLSLSFSVFLLISVSSYQFPHLCFFLSFRLSLSLSLSLSVVSLSHTWCLYLSSFYFNCDPIFIWFLFLSFSLVSVNFSF